MKTTVHDRVVEVHVHAVAACQAVDRLLAEIERRRREARKVGKT